MTIKTLEWDSNLFGYPVGLLAMGAGVVDEQRLQLEAQQYKLVYVTSSSPQEASILSCGDSKKVFGKTPKHHGIETEVVEIPENRMNQAINLGLQSGVYSRFTLDRHFNNQEFEKLYTIWVQRSIRKEIAYKTLTVLMDGQLAGIITLGEAAELESSIGLFAVDLEFRGQGIGTKLLKAAESLSFDRGEKRLTVATQGKNQAACEAYQKFGFELISETYIYNYWNGESTTFS
jgi:dTDP-4-amino-4,6-dideoxy-D-galactose acyltransferase